MTDSRVPANNTLHTELGRGGGIGHAETTAMSLSFNKRTELAYPSPDYGKFAREVSANDAAPSGSTEFWDTSGFSGLCGYFTATGAATCTLTVWAKDVPTGNFYQVEQRTGLAKDTEIRFKDVARSRHIFLQVTALTNGPITMRFSGE